MVKRSCVSERRPELAQVLPNGNELERCSRSFVSNYHIHFQNKRTMKKIYLKPETLLTILSTDYHLCTGSPNDTNPTNGLDGDLTDGGDNPGNFSRRRDIWEDEEEEEEK